MCVVKLMILLIVYLASPFFLFAVVPSLRNLQTSHQIYLLANVLVNGFGPRASVIISDFVVINESYEVFFKSRGRVCKQTWTLSKLCLNKAKASATKLV